MLLCAALGATACAGASATQPPSASRPPAPPGHKAQRAHHRRQPAASRRHRRRHAHGRARPSRPAARFLPDRLLTPGIALTASRRRICRPGYASSVRDVPESERREVYERYGERDVPYANEVDHLVSLELGGANALRNLWPEPYRGRWNARVKDVLENRLHELVCSGRLGLRRAQRLEARDWIAAYRRFVAPAPPAPSGTAEGARTSGASVSSGGFYLSRYPSASTVYCADDPTWRELSPRYLAHYRSLRAALRDHPRYHLHRPC